VASVEAAVAPELWIRPPNAKLFEAPVFHRTTQSTSTGRILVVEKDFEFSHCPYKRAICVGSRSLM
jgi:hypothetical protein